MRRSPAALARGLLLALALALGLLVAGYPAGGGKQLQTTGDSVDTAKTPAVDGSSSARPPFFRGPGRPANRSDAGPRPPPSRLFGISYAPYRADDECKSEQDIRDDLERLAGAYSVVRIYGTDCGQVPAVYSAARARGMKVFLGIWGLASLQDEANKIIAGVGGDWAMVHTVGVGNELVNSGRAGPRQVTEAVGAARGLLRDAGFGGPVVAVDTFAAVEAHPELCEQSDYCAVNAHAFFDSTVAAPDAGRWLRDTVARVASALAVPKAVVVTETGWPMRGDSNGLAVPSLEGQKAALDSIRAHFASHPADVILFSAFNDLWKAKDSATFNAEPYWGIGGAVALCDEHPLPSLASDMVVVLNGS